MASESSSTLLLKGLDGSNLLAFLAAVGTLRIATRARPSAAWHLKWCWYDGHWSPLLAVDEKFAPDEFIRLLMPTLKNMVDAPCLGFAKNLKVSRKEFQRVAGEIYESVSCSSRHFADFLVAFGSESLGDNLDEGSLIQNTEFCTLSAAGGQHFLGTMQELAKVTEPEQLHASLFAPWKRKDEKLSLRWDPQDVRRYALCRKNPSRDPQLTERGANRLAFEALPLFPTAPRERRLKTTGFTGTSITWPIWEAPISMESVRSLLSLTELQENLPNRDSLKARGVVEVYRSRRITHDRLRNFTPAVPV